MTYSQFIPYTDRLDYLAPLANNVAYVLAVEKLMGIAQQVPPRCQFIRVICCELARAVFSPARCRLLRHGLRGHDGLPVHVYGTREDL